MIFDSFQAGYLKALDWDLYCRLESSVAKRLYRFLDKRFYHRPEVTIDLHELAFRKLRLSDSYNTAQIKRVLLKGIGEMESLWELRSAKADRRFRKLSRGKWEAVFVKKKRRQPTLETQTQQAELQNQSLEVKLSKRGVGPAAAAELVADHPLERIRTMIELHDWHNARGQERGPGLIVAGIRSREPYSLPRGFRPSRPSGPSDEKSRIRSIRKRPKQADPRSVARQKSELEPFLAFWDKLDAKAQSDFEQQALAQAEPFKRRWFDDARTSGRETANYFRLAILNDHFRRTYAAKPGKERLLKT